MIYSVLSLGAGVNSTALLHVLLDEQMPLDEVVLADTGAEKPETYEYIEKWIKPFLAEKGVPYTVVKPKTQLIERCLHGHKVPDRHFRWSTRDMKINPIKKYLKPRKPVHVYLGICYDEIHRVKDSRIDWITNSWPLVDKRITRQDCVDILRRKGWEIPVKSGCFFCPFQGKKDWFWLWKTHPDLFELSKKIERNGSKYPNFALVDGTLEKLEKTFPALFKAEREQTTLPMFARIPLFEDEECSGFCMT